MATFGTFISWFSWLGFNGGSALVQTCVYAFCCAGGIIWGSLDYRLQHKFSMAGFCSGTIAGLIVARPASRFIQPWAAVIIGVVTSAVCNFCN